MKAEEMDHSYFQERLSAYLDGELAAEEKATLDEHLTGCDECRRRLEQLRKLDRLTAEQGELADNDYWETAAAKIEARLETAKTEVTDIRPERRGLYSGLWWKVPAVAASILIVGYIGFHEADIGPGEFKPSTVTSDDSIAIDQPAALEAETAPDTVEPAVAGEPAMETGRDTDVESSEEEIAVERKAPDTEAAGAERTGVEPEKAAEAETPSPQSLTVSVPETDYKKAVVDTVRARSRSALTGEDQSRVEAAGTAEDAAREKDLERESQTAEVPTPPEPEATGWLDENVPLEEVQKIKGAVEAGRSFAGERMAAREESEGSSDSLGYWRARRDSLLSVRDSLADEPPPVRGATAPKAMGNQSAILSYSSNYRQKMVKVEGDLLEAWYQVCRFSQDSSEVKQGKAFLRRIADDDDSRHRERAREYLQELDS